MSANESKILLQVVNNMGNRLGRRWNVKIDNSRTRAFDGLIKVANDSNKILKLGVELKQNVRPADAPILKARFDGLAKENPSIEGVLVSRYLTPSTRESLEEFDISYVDATGNARIETTNHGFVFIDRGEDRDPWRRPGRPTTTLKGEPATKVVRTLLDYRGPWRISDLIQTSKTSPGSVYRVLQFLESEALVEKVGNKLIVTKLSKLIERWSLDYKFAETNIVTNWVSPRGVEFALNKLRQSQNMKYTLTGSAAAATWSEYAPTKTISVYSNDPEEIIKALDLRETDYGSNVRIALPTFEVVTERASVREDGLRVASPSQVAVDLLGGPGREPSEGENLIRWMVANESAWRI